VAFHFPKEGPAEFFDSFRRASETCRRRFRNVLVANGPQYKFNPRTATPVDSIAFTSSNTDIGTLLWKISWMNSPLETQRRSRPNWKTFTNEFCVQHIVNKKNWIIIFVIVHSIFHISNVRSFNTYLFVSDRILPAATVRTIEWMGYLRSVIKPTHWVSSILNIGKKMKHLSLFCLYRLLKRKHGDIYRFNTLIRQFYRFDFPQRCSFLIRWNSIQPIDPLVQTI
jgi:hypothetical protein